MIGSIVNFVEEMPIKTKKAISLANEQNKQKFIYMLSAKSQEKGIKTLHADGDAHVQIVKTAVNSASLFPSTLIGEDTDLLVLLCMQPNQTKLPMLFRSEEMCVKKRKKI